MAGSTTPPIVTGLGMVGGTTPSPSVQLGSAARAARGQTSGLPSALRGANHDELSDLESHSPPTLSTSKPLGRKGKQSVDEEWMKSGKLPHNTSLNYDAAITVSLGCGLPKLETPRSEHNQLDYACHVACHRSHLKLEVSQRFISGIREFL